MGIEGRPLSIDHIRSALDRGEIIRGNKGFEVITTADGTFNFNRNTGQIYFDKDGVITHATIVNGIVSDIQLTESDTGAPYIDRDIAYQRKRLLETALDSKQLL